MDWYRSAEEQLSSDKICLLTDLIAGEGFTKLVNENDTIHRLLIIDSFLLKNQSTIGNIWRNIVKFLVMPFQIVLLKRFHAKNPDSIYHAHAMYYVWLAAAANVPFIGTPQGSDILIKPFRSRIFRFFSAKALKKAKYITVDSVKMQEKAFEISGVTPKIIQNGIDVKSIELFLSTKKTNENRNTILSIRALAALYRIDEAVLSRNKMQAKGEYPITFIYPFLEGEYKEKVFQSVLPYDIDLGRVTRDKMYEILFDTKLVISIPSSDSSPRSVYEAIFCGAAVAISYDRFYDVLPNCMKERIILIDIANENFIEEAIEKAKIITKTKFTPSVEALDLFDQRNSFKRILNLIKE